MLMLKPHPLPPKPLPKPKRALERKSRRMTLANAFRCRNGGILLCADREENDGYNKREVDKIYRIRELHAFEVFITGSGPSGIINKTCERLHESLLKAEYSGVDLWQNHSEVVEAELSAIHIQYQDHLQPCPMNLLIVIAERSRYSPLLYRTELGAIMPEHVYAACGSGKPISDYLADRLYIPEQMDKGSLGILAAFIFREAEKSSSGVGLGADMIFIFEGNRSLHIIPSNKVKELESSIPQLGDCVHSFWQERVVVPSWLTLSEVDSSQSQKP